MSRTGVRKSSRSTRQKLRSPGRPPVGRREAQVRFWEAIARGVHLEGTLAAAHVSWVVGGRWFHHAGGMPPTHLAPSAPPLSGRYLSFAEREALALLRAQGHSVRACARHLKQAPSTISRELRRNAATREGVLDYRATTAQWPRGSRSAAIEAGGARRRRAPASLCSGVTGWRDHHPNGVPAAGPSVP